MERRQLILMRHATAEAGGGRDHARRLTDVGRDEAHRVGRWLASRAMTADRVLCSTALRCRETSQALVAGQGLDLAIDFEDRLYNAPAESLLDSLTGLSASDASGPEREDEIVLLIAHNPGVSHLALELTDESTGASRLRAGFSPATVACFEIKEAWSLLRPGSAHLTHFLHVTDL